MPWAAIIPAVIGAAGSYLAARKASKAGKPTKTQTLLEQQLYDINSKTGPMGLDQTQQGLAGLDSIEEYLRKLGYGDWSTKLDVLSPELTAQDDTSRTANSMDLALAPYKAGSAERRVGVLDDAVRRRNDAILGLKTDAIGGLGEIANQRANIGTSLLSGTSSSSLGTLGAILGRRNASFDQQRSAGNALFELLKLFGGMNFGGTGAGATAAAGGSKGGSTGGTAGKFGYG